MKTKETKEPKPPRPRCERCGLAIVRTPYGRWKHVGNGRSGKGCGQEPKAKAGAT